MLPCILIDQTEEWHWKVSPADVRMQDFPWLISVFHLNPTFCHDSIMAAAFVEVDTTQFEVRPCSTWIWVYNQVGEGDTLILHHTFTPLHSQGPDSVCFMTQFCTVCLSHFIFLTHLFFLSLNEELLQRFSYKLDSHIPVCEPTILGHIWKHSHSQVIRCGFSQTRGGAAERISLDCDSSTCRGTLTCLLLPNDTQEFVTVLQCCFSIPPHYYFVVVCRRAMW